MNDLTIMIYRQVKRLIRSRSKLVGSLINPIIWMVFFGLGWSNVFNFPMAKAIFGGVDYMAFLVPGIVVMTIFTTSFMGGINIIWDKQFGFLKELLVAPANRKLSILGRTIGDALVATIQSLIVILLALALVEINVAMIPLALAIGFITALIFSSLGAMLSLKINNMEGFVMIMNILMFPLLFASGIFYPYKTMPNWMKAMAKAIPLTYSIDLIRHFLVGTPLIFNIFTDLMALFVFLIINIVLVMILFERTTIE